MPGEIPRPVRGKAFSTTFLSAEQYQRFLKQGLGSSAEKNAYRHWG